MPEKAEQKILLIGPRINIKDPSKTGGAIVLFENLIVEMQKLDIDFKVIDTNKRNYINILFAYMSITGQIFIKHWGCKYISLHSSNDYRILSLWIILLGKLFNKETSLRKFGGEAKNVYTHEKGKKKKLLTFIFTHMDILFFEIKDLQKFFSKIHKDTYWFPNVRERTQKPLLPREYKKRFVFISQVTQEKGIDEILEASLHVGESYVIDIYGPIPDKKYSEKYFKNYNIRYLGALKSTEVISVLDKYDVLLLPTFYKGEGYPGIIIEAYSLGIPVITTPWQGIVEVVEEEKTGIFVEIKNAESLVKAIKNMDKIQYKNLSKNAYEKFDDFKCDIQTKLFLKRLGL